MAKADIFDEIIECLKNSAEEGRYASLSKPTADDFFSDMPGFKPEPPAPQKSSQASAQRIPAQGHPIPRSLPPEPKPKAPAEGSGEAHQDYSSFGWDELAQAVKSCARCPLHAGRTRTVFGDGSRKAELMFIGEGPGADEDAQGLPFVGRAGELLTRMILAMQFKREEVYIANIVKCRPPNNRQPEEEEAAVCLPFLLRQIELLKPKVIVTLGATPLKALLKKTGVSRLRGNWLDFNGIQVMPTFHPAFLLRNPPAKKEVWEDLQKVMEVFGKKHLPKADKRQ